MEMLDKRARKKWNINPRSIHEQYSAGKNEGLGKPSLHKFKTSQQV